MPESAKKRTPFNYRKFLVISLLVIVAILALAALITALVASAGIGTPAAFGLLGIPIYAITSALGITIGPIGLAVTTGLVYSIGIVAIGAALFTIGTKIRNALKRSEEAPSDISSTAAKKSEKDALSPLEEPAAGVIPMEAAAQEPQPYTATIPFETIHESVATLMQKNLGLTLPVQSVKKLNELEKNTTETDLEAIMIDDNRAPNAYDVIIRGNLEITTEMLREYHNIFVMLGHSYLTTNKIENLQRLFTPEELDSLSKYNLSNTNDTMVQKALATFNEEKVQVNGKDALKQHFLLYAIGVLLVARESIQNLSLTHFEYAQDIGSIRFFAVFPTSSFTALDNYLDFYSPTSKENKSIYKTNEAGTETVIIHENRGITSFAQSEAEETCFTKNLGLSVHFASTIHHDTALGRNFMKKEEPIIIQADDQNIIDFYNRLFSWPFCPSLKPEAQSEQSIEAKADVLNTMQVVLQHKIDKAPRESKRFYDLLASKLFLATKFEESKLHPISFSEEERAAIPEALISVLDNPEQKNSATINQFLECVAYAQTHLYDRRHHLLRTKEVNKPELKNKILIAQAMQVFYEIYYLCGNEYDEYKRNPEYNGPDEPTQKAYNNQLEKKNKLLAALDPSSRHNLKQLSENDVEQTSLVWHKFISDRLTNLQQDINRAIEERDSNPKTSAEYDTAEKNLNTYLDQRYSLLCYHAKKCKELPSLVWHNFISDRLTNLQQEKNRILKDQNNNPDTSTEQELLKKFSKEKEFLLNLHAEKCKEMQLNVDADRLIPSGSRPAP